MYFDPSLGRSSLSDQSILKIDKIKVINIGNTVHFDIFNSCSRHTCKPFVIIDDLYFSLSIGFKEARKRNGSASPTYSNTYNIQSSSDL